jgi:hypothetical protein
MISMERYTLATSINPVQVASDLCRKYTSPTMTITVDWDDFLNLIAGSSSVEVLDIRGTQLSEMVAALKDAVPQERAILILNLSCDRDISMDELSPLSDWYQQVGDMEDIEFGIGRCADEQMQLVLVRVV